MSTSPLGQRIKTIVSRISRIDIAELKEEVLIREELGIDSLMAMEIVATCERELALEIDEAQLYEVQTVGDFLRLVEEKYNETCRPTD